MKRIRKFIEKLCATVIRSQYENIKISKFQKGANCKYEKNAQRRAKKTLWKIRSSPIHRLAAQVYLNQSKILFMYFYISHIIFFYMSTFKITVQRRYKMGETPDVYTFFMAVFWGVLLEGGFSKNLICTSALCRARIGYGVLLGKNYAPWWQPV